jgi:hypothetical protein
MQRGLKQGVNQVVGPPWPSRIEDLENTNGRRFLRKRYIDPMTGTDEWRFIHINNGVLTDSINNKPQQNNQTQEGMRQGGITEQASLMDSLAGAGRSPGNAAQLRKRPSDSAGSSGGASPSDPNAPVNPGDSGSAPAPPAGPVAAGGNPGMPPGSSPFPVPPQTGAGPAGGSGNWGQPGSLQPPMVPGIPPGQPSYPGQIGGAINSNVQPNSPYATGPNASGNPPFFPQPGSTTGFQSPQQLIGNLLTQPRPNGPPTAVPNGNNTIGGGIAGVASKMDDDSIMVCADHTNYQEWEFIFDPSKWRAPADPRKTVVGTPAGNNSSSSPSTGPGSAPSTQPGGGMGGPSSGPSTGQGQNPAGGQPGANQNAICGMEARPGIQ